MTKRKYEVIPRSEGIYRILNYDEKNKKWVEPLRGAKFAAVQYVVTHDGRRCKTRPHFQTFVEAKLFRSKGELEQQENKPEVSKMLFRELIGEWREKWLPHKAISTQIRYRSYLQHFRYFSDMEVGQIQPTDIDGWVSLLKSPEYLNQFHSTRCGYRHEYSLLRQIFGFYASRYDRNFRLPFLSEHRKMLKVREKVKLKKDLSIKEFESFMKSLSERVFGTDLEVVFYLALMQYGIFGRLQDVAALHYEDFNLQRGEVSITRKVVWPRAKGYEPFLESGSKVGSGRTIPLSDLARRVFREWTLKQGIRSGLLFSYKGSLLTYRQIEHHYTEALKLAGLPFSATHILRHASLTEFYDTSKDLLQTQRVAGHTSVRTTEKYAKVRDERVFESQREMDKKFASFLPSSASPR